MAVDVPETLLRRDGRSQRDIIRQSLGNSGYQLTHRHSYPASKQLVHFAMREDSRSHLV